MNKNLIKIITIITILFLIMLLFNTTVEASSVVSDIKSNISTGTSVSNSVKSTGKTVLGVLNIVATGTAIVMLLYIAIKYMISAPDAKAEYKKTATMYAIGAVIIFIAPKLARMVINMSQNITGNLAK